MSNEPDAARSVVYSAVVPVYRGAATVETLADRLVRFFRGQGQPFEVIFVDDGSRDGSWERVQAAARRHPEVLGVRLSRNFGQHNATLCGLRHASGQLIVTLDEDLQNPPEEIAKLLECQRRESADVVYGISERRRHSWWRRTASRVVMVIPRMVMKLPFDLSAFRLLRAPIARELARVERHDVILDVYISWVTNRIAAVAVHQDESSHRRSSYSVLRLARVLLDLICNYTVLPLRVSALAGAAISVLSVGLGIYFIYMRLHYNVTPGFSAVMVTITFATGLSLLAIGIVSEYLARTFLHIIGKPQAVVRATTRDDGGGSDAQDEAK